MNSTTQRQKECNQRLALVRCVVGTVIVVYLVYLTCTGQWLSAASCCVFSIVLTTPYLTLMEKSFGWAFARKGILSRIAPILVFLVPFQLSSLILIVPKKGWIYGLS